MADIVTAAATGDGTLHTGKGLLRGFIVRAAGTAGTVVLKDGGSGGTTIMTLNTPAVVSAVPFTVPGNGVAFATDLYVDVTTADGITVFIEPDRSL